MIIDAIVKILTGLVTGLLALFPAYTLPGSATDAGVSMGSWLGFANAYFPVTALAVALSMVIGARVFVFGWKLCVTVYDLIPFKAT